jgi:hypothetical protein
MKASLALLLLSVSLCLSADLPTFRDVPGHLVINQCDPFSKAAVLKLHKLGIPAVRITYGWQNPSAGRGYHAALIFRHEGKTYVMDNEHRAPLVVKGKTDISAAIRLTGLDFYTSVWMVNEANQKVKPRALADLFKPNPEWLEKYRIDKQ